MDEQAATDYSLALPGAWLDCPWGPGSTVIKIGEGRGRIFVHLVETRLSVKCGRTREEADDWLDRYPEQARVMPYDGRFGWNSLDYTIPEPELIEAIRDSYRFAVAALPKSQRPDGYEAI